MYFVHEPKPRYMLVTYWEGKFLVFYSEDAAISKDINGVQMFSAQVTCEYEDLFYVQWQKDQEFELYELNDMRLIQAEMIRFKGTWNNTRHAGEIGSFMEGMPYTAEIEIDLIGGFLLVT